MGLFGAPQPPEDLNEKMTAPPDFKGPVEKRKCTDILFLLLIVAMWVAMTGLGIDSVSEGEPLKLIAPMDDQGRLCGYDSGVEDKPDIYFLNENLAGVCVKSCPHSTIFPTSNFSDLICFNASSAEAHYGSVAKAIESTTCLYKVKSKSYFNRCFFEDVDVSGFDINSNDYASTLTQFGSDLYTTRGYVFGLAFALALVAGFVFCVVVRIPFVLPVVVWGCIFGILIALLGGAWLLLTTASSWDDDGQHSNNEVTGCKILAYILFGIAALYACVILFLRKRISLAMGVIKEAAKAMGDMPSLILYPVFQLAGLILFMIPLLYYVMYTAGMADLNTTEVAYTHGQKTYTYKYRSIEFTKDVEERLWFFFFCYLWTSEFIIALGQITLAVAFATWYFTRQQPGKLILVTSMKAATLYHAGTAAFGSLIIAIIKLIRAIVAKIQKKCKQSGNRVALAILCCIQCCLWCLEKCMKFLNKNAYIQTAIFSYSFCTAARKAFGLLLRNIARVAAIGFLSEILIFIGKIFVAAVATLITYVAINYAKGDEIYSIIGPTIAAFLVSYMVACCFMNILHMGIDTIFMCFVADEEMFKENPFARPELQKYMDDLPKARKDLGIGGKTHGNA